MTWGAVQPEQSGQARLRLDFGLRPAILALNDWAVPGLGGAFFVRQLAWSCMGLRLTTSRRTTTPMRVAEGLEALAGWIVVRQGARGESERRIQGRRKFAGQQSLAFRDVSERGAYVTVPFRRSAKRALPGLGLCREDAPRFNDLKLSQAGIELAELALAGADGTGRARDLLLAWIDEGGAIARVAKPLAGALLPASASMAEKALVLACIRSRPRRTDLADRLHDFPDARLATASGRDAFLASLADRAHAGQLRLCFDFEEVRAAATQAAQALRDAVKTAARDVADLGRQPDIAAAFASLGARCASLLALGASQLPDEAVAFCRAQDGAAALAGRIAELAGRAPALFTLAGTRLDRGFAFTDKPLVLAEDADPEDDPADGPLPAIPRPLMRLRTLLEDAGAFE